MPDAYEKMCSTLEERALLPAKGGALLMVSGGSDSTALAYLMARYRDEHPEGLGALTMLHMNHKLRGADADEDAHFVESLASRLDMPLFMCEMDIAAEAARTGENVEAVARHERYAAAYDALTSMCQHEGIPLSDARILTAHTVDDRIENFYMRSIVGTGPGGFRSMLFKNGNVVRPLLDCTREGLRDHIERLAGEGDAVRDEDGALWREDATNAHTDRFRAYVRHEIVPKAREWNPNLDATLGRTMDLIADEDDMIEAMAEEILNEDVDRLEAGFMLKPSFGSVLVPLQRRVVRKLLQEMLGLGERIDTVTVEAVLEGFDEEGSIKSGYVTNIQGDLAVSANKQGVRVEPMSEYRARRKRV